MTFPSSNQLSTVDCVSKNIVYPNPSHSYLPTPACTALKFSHTFRISYLVIGIWLCLPWLASLRQSNHLNFPLENDTSPSLHVVWVGMTSLPTCQLFWGHVTQFWPTSPYIPHLSPSPTSPTSHPLPRPQWLIQNKHDPSQGLLLQLLRDLSFQYGCSADRK